MKSETIRAVFLEREVFERSASGVAAVALFGRALWAFNTKVEAKMWIRGIDLAGLSTRSRSITGVATPLAAQEWAYDVWDEYVRDVRVAWERSRLPAGPEPHL